MVTSRHRGDISSLCSIDVDLHDFVTYEVSRVILKVFLDIFGRIKDDLAVMIDEGIEVTLAAIGIKRSRVKDFVYRESAACYFSLF